MNRRR